MRGTARTPGTLLAQRPRAKKERETIGASKQTADLPTSVSDLWQSTHGKKYFVLILFAFYRLTNVGGCLESSCKSRKNINLTRNKI